MAIASQYDGLVAAGRDLLWQWRLAEAAAAFEAALRLRPEAAAAHYLRGEALFLQRRIDEALASHRAARRRGLDRDAGGRAGAMSGIVPGDFAWMSHMLRGDLAQAWRLADRDRAQRRRAGIATAAWPRHLRPVWDGSPLAGRRVLMRCWHGLGDTIQFVRYAPLLAERVRALCVEAPAELLPLLRRVPGIDRLHPLAAGEPGCRDLGCDCAIEITELPHAFRTTLDTIPASIPYLTPDPALAAATARRIGSLSARLAVGLVWAAGAWKPERSIPLAKLAPLAAVPGVALVTLQGGPEHERWRAAAGRGRGAGPAMADFGCARAHDLALTAATIAGLDLVITVDTMAAHLAGALGVPAWLMLHYAGDWRWLLDRSDSPWYPTMRLFRQPRPGAWDGVVAEVAAALRQHAAARGNGPES